MANLDQYLQTNRAAFEDQLCELLRIPSVSTDGQFAGEVAKAGQWVADQFKFLLVLVMALMTVLTSTTQLALVKLVMLELK